MLFEGLFSSQIFPDKKKALFQLTETIYLLELVVYMLAHREINNFRAQTFV